GFSLIEVVVAIGVVGVGIVAVMNTVTGLSGGAAYTADSIAAAALAGSLMAEIDTRAYSGTTATPTGRVIDNLRVYYPFDDASGTTVTDQSRVQTLAPLTIADPNLAMWIPGANGINVTAGGTLKTAAGASKVSAACIASGQVTVEAWVEPLSLTCGESPIISLATDFGHMNFILAQNAGDLRFYIRTRSTDSHGRPPTVTLTAPLQKQPTHCVATFNGTIAAIYVNGSVVIQSIGAAGDLSSWQSHPIQVAALKDFGTTWAGKVFLAAVYSRALTADEVSQNYLAGPSASHAANRVSYDDIDDYNGYSDSPPRAEDGTVIAGAGAFRRTVDVRNVLPANINSVQSWDSTDAKRIRVSIYRDNKLLLELVRARYRNVSIDDPPDPGY
ncbi:MAG TPA: LamG domain-containing protein, partial [Planctomycetota bacterium]|nr:LamG domain-containing protein [Planctomycetota bacterium]